MGVKVGTSCLHWTHPLTPQYPPQTLASTISLKRCSFSDGALVFKHLRKPNPIRSSGSDSSSPSFPDEEFAKQLLERAAGFQIPPAESESGSDSDSAGKDACGNHKLEQPDMIPPGISDSDSAGKDACGNHKLFGRLEQPDWLLQPPTTTTTTTTTTTDMIPAGIERKASSVELPLSIRMIKRKRQKWGCRTESTCCCSVNKAFSSMVFIIRELQCFAIQAREAILCEDLQGILSRVHKEMHASFVWLFQQVFSRTPTLMVYVMILLANYSVHSMTAFAAPTETVSILEYKNHKNFGPSTFSVRSNFGKTESVGGGDGGSFRPVSSGTDGGGRFRSERSIFPDGVREREKESVSGQERREEEARLWDSIVDDAMKMQSEMRDEALDTQTLKRFVSPVSAKVESEDYTNYFRTQLFYQMGLAEDPINPLLLANYAQFLYLVARDYNRAEEYFKRAVKVKPPDAEALSKYASFLWQAKKDLWGAEENYLDAISADPTNSYYAANYAHFLWSTGGEDTCYPIDALDTNNDDA